MAAGAAPLLARALEAVHVGRRAAHVLKHTLEAGVKSEAPRLPEQRFLAAPLDGATLVHGDRAEMALPVAAAMRCQRKANGLQGLDGALFFIMGVLIVDVSQCIDRVQFFHTMGCWRRILHQVAGVLPLAEHPAGYGIVIVIELREHRVESFGIAGYGFVVRQNQGFGRWLIGLVA